MCSLAVERRRTDRRTYVRIASISRLSPSTHTNCSVIFDLKVTLQFVRVEGESVHYSTFPEVVDMYTYTYIMVHGACALYTHKFGLYSMCIYLRFFTASWFRGGTVGLSRRELEWQSHKLYMYVHVDIYTVHSHATHMYTTYTYMVAQFGNAGLETWLSRV